MSRFHYTGTTDHSYRGITGVVIMLLVVCLFVFSIRHFGTYTEDKQLESLHNALRRDIIQCYAIEGIYPPSLSYLEEHYGLTYDHDRFYVDYHPVAANLYPDVTVLETGGK